MIRYVVDGEPLREAVIHAAMMAGSEARGGAKDIGYVLVCKKCYEPIGDHKDPRDCEIFQRNNELLNRNP